MHRSVFLLFPAPFCFFILFSSSISSSLSSSFLSTSISYFFLFFSPFFFFFFLSFFFVFVCFSHLYSFLSPLFLFFLNVYCFSSPFLSLLLPYSFLFISYKPFLNLFRQYTVPCLRSLYAKRHPLMRTMFSLCELTLGSKCPDLGPKHLFIGPRTPYL